MDKLLDRFFNYVSFDTQAKANVKSVPSTEGQRKLAQALFHELQTLGFSQVSLSDHGCVMATLPANVSWPVPTIGFIAHLDTSPDFSGKNVNPQILENYRGGDVALDRRRSFITGDVPDIASATRTDIDYHGWKDLIRCG